MVYGGVAWESCALSWLAVALPLGRLQKKKGNKKAEWQPERGKRSSCKCRLEQGLWECRWRIKDKAEPVMGERVALLWRGGATGNHSILK